MTKQEVLDKIGKENWKAFDKWMRGQTVGVNDDLTLDYYECDVNAFKHKLDTGFDRQEDPLLWD